MTPRTETRTDRSATDYPDSDALLQRVLASASTDADPDPDPETEVPAPVQQRITLQRRWLATPDTIELDVRYRFGTDPGGTTVHAEVGGLRVALDAPVALEPVRIPKPWGQEIWHTGIEARGESRVRCGDGWLPLSQYLALAPQRLCGRAPLVLLKILDPRPEPVLGDLYFEVHEEKQEVYVVTRVDPDAWPDGAGRIRFGMNQALRAEYADDHAFRAAYLQAVRAYEHERRAIDAGTSRAGAREQALRAAMERFTEFRDLRQGDVVVVPTWLPHALQHGVRVIEFQTPTYERYIISFAQRVLTQEHWDTGTAVARMHLDAPPPEVFREIAPGVERIVAFDDFSVWRVTVAPGSAFDLPAHPCYALCIGVSGTLSLGALELRSEQAAFVPRSVLDSPERRTTLGRVRNRGPEPACLLIAAPDL